MNPVDAKGLADEVREWAEKNPEEAPPAAQPTAAPQPTSSSQPQSPQPSAAAAAASSDDDDDEASDFALDFTEIAELGVTALDYGIQNFVSPRCAYKPWQKAELARLGGKVLAKWLPEIGGSIEPEWALLGTAGLFAFGNYKASLRSSPEPARTPASPPGGSEKANGHSGGPTTDATVDGRDVKAQVLQ